MLHRCRVPCRATPQATKADATLLRKQAALRGTIREQEALLYGKAYVDGQSAARIQVMISPLLMTLHLLLAHPVGAHASSPPLHL